MQYNTQIIHRSSSYLYITLPVQRNRRNICCFRLVLFDYRKAFDLIDHHLIVQKLNGLDIPLWVLNWVTDFLSNRYQRVKLSNVCYSDWRSVPSGVPQGTKLGPWLFLLMINDLRVPNVPTWKYVDDTSIAETVPKEALSNAQAAVTSVEVWSRVNHMQLHPLKCKELIVDFSRDKRVLIRLRLTGYVFQLFPKQKY